MRLLLAQRYELGDSPLPSSQLEAADDAYRILEKKVIHDDQLKKLMFDFSTPIFKIDFLELEAAHQHTLTSIQAKKHPLAGSGGPREALGEKLRKLMDDMPKPCPLALINFLGYDPWHSSNVDGFCRWVGVTALFGT